MAAHLGAAGYNSMVTQQFNFRGNKHNATAPRSTKNLPISDSLDTRTRGVNTFKSSTTEFMHHISKEQKHVHN
jgi:hypothetical protein